MIRLGNNEVLKTLMKTLTFVDMDTNAEGSTIALRERCSGKLKVKTRIISYSMKKQTFGHAQKRLRSAVHDDNDGMGIYKG